MAKTDFLEIVRQSEDERVIDLIQREDKWQLRLVEFLEEYGDDDRRTATIDGIRYLIKVLPRGDVAVRLVMVREVKPGEVYWKKAEKTSKTADQFKAEWLEYLASHNIPLHDPANEIKEVKPFSIIE